MSDRSEQLARSWRANAEAWTRAVRDGAIASRTLATDAAVLEAIRERRPDRVLDVGCGEGWLVRALAADGIEAAGVDASAPLVERARAAGGSFEARSYAELASDPASAGGPYDAVVLNFALFEEDAAPLLQGLRGALAPGGALVVQTVHPWSGPGGEGYRDGWRVESFAGLGDFPEPMPWYFRTMASWFELLRASGYRLERLREPAHPDTLQPLSLLLVAMPC